MHNASAAVMQVNPLAGDICTNKNIWRARQVEGEAYRLGRPTAALLLPGVSGQFGDPVNVPARPPGLLQEFVSALRIGLGFWVAASSVVRVAAETGQVLRPVV